MEEQRLLEYNNYLSHLLDALKTWFWDHDGFAGEVYAYAEQHADFFESLSQYFAAGGQEHALEWTHMHRGFAEEFNGHVNIFLNTHGITLETLQQVFAMAKETGDEQAAVILDLMLSVMDYEQWLRSMLALARQKKAEAAEAAGVPAMVAGETEEAIVA